MKKLVLVCMLSAVLCLTACNSVSDKNNETTSKTAELSSPDTLTKLILEDTDIPTDAIYSDIRIVPINSESGIDSQQYVVMIKNGSFWADAIWYLKFDGQKIIDKREIQDVSGNVISCEVVELSQGTYVEFNSSTHMGNGTTSLWSPFTKVVEYTFDGLTTDNHREGYVEEKIVKKYNLPRIQKEKGYGYSFVYQGGTLTSYYEDMNDDGQDDVIFYGIKNLVLDEDDIPIKIFSVKQVYLYDEAQEIFILDEKLSEERELQ